MDIDGFWGEALRRWPTLVARLASARDPTQATWGRDPDAPFTSLQYTDGPPKTTMTQVVAAFGGRTDWVNRRFSVGALLLLHEAGQGAGTGLRQPRSDSGFDPDLSDSATAEQIIPREKWAEEHLSRELRLSIKTDEALSTALEVLRYPFLRPSPVSATLEEPLPMAVAGAQEFLDVEAVPLERLTSDPNHGLSDVSVEVNDDRLPVLMNLTGWTLYLPSGATIPLPSEESDIPTCLEIIHCNDHLDVGVDLDGEPSQMPVAHVTGYEVRDLPSARPGVMLVVHQDVLDAAPHRPDLVTVGRMRRPDDWLPFDPETDFDALPDDYWDRWTVLSLISRHVDRCVAADADATKASDVSGNATNFDVHSSRP